MVITSKKGPYGMNSTESESNVNRLIRILAVHCFAGIVLRLLFVRFSFMVGILLGQSSIPVTKASCLEQCTRKKCESFSVACPCCSKIDSFHCAISTLVLLGFVLLPVSP